MVCSRDPLVIIPGIAGTYAAQLFNDISWLMHRGVAPSASQIDPLAKTYADLVKTFESVGYIKDSTLFIVNYDWRLPLGPDDGTFDGSISGISASSISDATYEFGIDYLGDVLRRVMIKHPKARKVNVIAHSTGGLLARAYIQSPAYNEVFEGTQRLPRIGQFMMLGVPNRGASKAWNPLHNDWSVDNAYKYVLSKMLLRVYQEVVHKGGTVTGPQPITRADILDANNRPDPIKFINLYVPTIRSLLATYPFLDEDNGYLVSVNSRTQDRNAFLLDLNAGAPNRFVDSTEKTTVIYGKGVQTPSTVKKHAGSGGRVYTFEDYWFTTTSAIWYSDEHDIGGDGDGTVPLASSIEPFGSDSRVGQAPIEQGSGGDASHLGLCYNVNVLRLALHVLGESFRDPDDISTNLHNGIIGSFLGSLNIIVRSGVAAVFDPVDGYVLDGANRRLGFTAADSALAEMPNSVWFGNQSGMGWIFGEPEFPLSLHLTGRGEDYYVMVSGETEMGSGGLVVSGFLGAGEVVQYPIVFDSTSTTAVNDGRTTGRLQFSGVIPNPSTGAVRFDVDIPVGAGEISLKVYDAAGRFVARPQQGLLERGRWSVAWLGTDSRGRRVPPGIYFARLEVGGLGGR